MSGFAQDLYLYAIMSAETPAPAPADYYSMCAERAQGYKPGMGDAARAGGLGSKSLSERDSRVQLQFSRPPRSDRA